MRASATWVDGTALSPVIVRGLTTPEKRMNSAPWLMAICFSPDTTRLLLGSTSITVTVMVPLKVLAALAPPPAFSELAPLMSAFWLVPNSPPSARGTALNASAVLPVRLALVAEFLLALTFSLITIVRMSPTLRGRRSSNSGFPAYEDA
jgi:hypothetical protein